LDKNKAPCEKQTPKTTIKNVSAKDLASQPVVQFGFDPFIRAIGRFIESSTIQNPYLRIPFRFLTEIFRYGGGASINGLIKNEKADKASYLKSLRKALENTAATIILEPNNYENRFTRVLVGFANNFIRIAVRIGLALVNVIDAGDVDTEGVADEFLGRSVFRSIYSPSTNPVVGTFVRFLEQAGINFCLGKMPVKNFVLPKMIQKTRSKKPC
jgi:hypothetical protein